jgi:hypothetical protein
LSIVDFKLHQLLELYVTIGLPECSNVYFECIRELSAIVKSSYFKTYNCVERFFDKTVTFDIDTDLEQCMGMVSSLYELEEISERHTTSSFEQAGESKFADLKGNMTSLLKRLMEESRDEIIKFVMIVQHDDNLSQTSESDFESLLVLGQSAALCLDKMRSLAQLPNRGVYYITNSEMYLTLFAAKCRIEICFYHSSDVTHLLSTRW